MNTRQLQYVLTLAEEKSFSEAANKLLISQPSLSQYIQKLEKEIGTELFERTVPLKLTYAGETYVEAAKKIVLLEDEMMEKITDISGGTRGKLYIGVSFLNSTTFIPQIVKLYQDCYPDVEIIICEDTEPNLKLRADAGELDLIFSTSKFDNLQYVEEEMCKEEFLLAVPKKMCSGSRESKPDNLEAIKIQTVKDLPFIMLMANTYIYEIVEKIYQKAGVKPRCAVACTSVTAAYGMVKAGVGLTLIPYSMYKNDYCSNVNYFQIEDNEYKRMVGLYYHKNRYISNIMTEFIKATKKYFKETYGVREI